MSSNPFFCLSMYDVETNAAWYSWVQRYPQQYKCLKAAFHRALSRSREERGVHELWLIRADGGFKLTSVRDLPNDRYFGALVDEQALTSLETFVDAVQMVTGDWEPHEFAVLIANERHPHGLLTSITAIPDAVIDNFGPPRVDDGVDDFGTPPADDGIDHDMQPAAHSTTYQLIRRE